MSEPTATTRPVVSAADTALPLSPHLQVWRWTVTMASSIAQRATGIAQYGGMILLVAWLLSGAISAEAYGAVTGLLGSPFGMLILFGFTLSTMYHLSKGILHLVWDSGHLISKEQAKPATALCFVSAVVLTGLIWAIVLGTGA